MLRKTVEILKKALGYIKLAALYLPKLIGLLEKKPVGDTPEKETKE